MKNILQFSFVFIIILFTNNKVYCQWQEQNSGFTQKLYCVSFVNKNVGYVGGITDSVNTTFLKTIDGGVSWNLQQIPTINSIYDVFFVNEKIGFVLTFSDPPEGYRTNDSGITWIQFNPKIFDYSNLYFKNETIGFAFSCNNQEDVAYTVDGGQSWTRVANNTFPGNTISAIHFPEGNSGIGYATSGWGGIVYKTYNNGLNWTQIAQTSSIDLTDIYFTSIDTGYVLGPFALYKTNDGGLNWTIINNTIYNGFNFKFFGNICYVLNHSSVYKSINGVLSFIQMTGINGINIYLNDFSFPVDNTGYCVVNNGKIYKFSSNTTIDATTALSNRISVFPNPVNDYLTIEASINSIGEIINLQGVIVKYLTLKNSKNKIDLKDLINGVYYIKIKTDKEIIVKKMIKQ